ncbi:MAG: apolipoprotein N-acyltransferase [Thermoanaerobaculia bacterium]|nr:apolipoprotein N-acyltransferase [Thermoanaerobaculia bacterium]
MPPSRPRAIGAAWVLLALAGGLLWALCFQRRPLSLASWLALAPLFPLLAHRRAGRLVWLHGVAFWVGSIPWIASTVREYGGLPEAASWLVLLGLAGVLALFQLPFGLLGPRLWRGSGPAAPFTLAALWTALEWARAHLLTGFPWNLAGTAWAELPGALELAPWSGVYGLSFLVVLVNAGAALAARRRSLKPLAVTWLPVLAALAGAQLGATPLPVEGEDAATVHLLQPNAAVSMTFDPERARSDYRQLERMSTAACRARPGLLIWPESAAWPFTPALHDFLRRDLERLGAMGCPVLLNAAERRDGASYNAVLLTRPGGGGFERTAKRHLVPFGEYVPAPVRILPGVGKLARNVGDFTPGESAHPLPWGAERLGVSVCYEVIFPAEVAATVRRGATGLVNVNNDGWYGDTAAPWQHFRAARLRAAEMRRPLLRAALTGVSGVVAADGRVVSRLGVGERGVITVRVSGRRGLTPAARLPWLTPAAALLLAAFAIFRASRR